MTDVPDSPRVSVVLPTFRRPDLLPRAVDTVRSQTFEDWELIVVDDNGAGTHAQLRTARVMEGLSRDGRCVYLVHETNRGGGAARNTGIRAARGEFVAFLDDDDVWYPAKLALQVECFDRSPADTALVYGGYRRVFVHRRSETVVPAPEGHTFTQLLRGNPIGSTSLILCRKAALDAVDGFDEHLRSRQDIDLYVRLARTYSFGVVPDVLIEKHQHEHDAIGKNYGPVVTAYARFYDKHRSELERDPIAHRVFLTRFGEEAFRAEQTGLARKHFWRAWLLDPRILRNAVLAAVAHPCVLRAYRTMRRRLASRGSGDRGGAR